MTPVGADMSFNLNQLNEWVGQEEQIIGPITAIDDGETCTVASFDEDRPALDSGFARVYLSVSGAAVVAPGKTLVCRGKAYLSGVLMDVFLVR